MPIELAGNGPVFIVGMNGSGTSMMLDCLGRHPDLFAVPHETLMMPHIIKQASRFGGLDDDANFIAYGQYALDQMPVLRRIAGTKDLELPENFLDMPRSVGGVFEGIFGALAAKQGKRRWCEKTPDHVQHLPLLSEVFPNAKFVHMIRDGREVAASISRRQQRTPELVMYRWKKLVTEGQARGAGLGDRYHEIRYETLTERPLEEMQGLCSFLGVGFSESILQSRMPQDPRRKKLGGGKLGTISANPVKWPDYFDAAAVERLEGVGGILLSRLGYDVGTAAGDNDPSPWRRKLWRALDFLRYHITLKKRRQRYSWPRLLEKMYFSFKEYRSKRY